MSKTCFYIWTSVSIGYTLRSSQTNKNFTLQWVDAILAGFVDVDYNMLPEVMVVDKETFRVGDLVLFNTLLRLSTTQQK